MTLELKQHNQRVREAYYRGFKSGLLVAIVLYSILFATYVHMANQRLIAEVKATDYYYSLTKN